MVTQHPITSHVGASFEERRFEVCGWTLSKQVDFQIGSQICKADIHREIDNDWLADKAISYVESVAANYASL